jgi:predicted nucleotidyltransferase component of viral defense system
MEEVVRTLEATGVFVARKTFESAATVKIERLVYGGLLDQAGAIKVEIDRLQDVVLPAVEKTCANANGIEATIQTMQLDEIVAEKVRATSNRARYRDFYDLYLLLAGGSTDLARALTLVRQKEVGALVASEEIRKNWMRALEQSEQEKRAIDTRTSVDDATIEAMVKGLDFLPILPLPPK